MAAVDGCSRGVDSERRAVVVGGGGESGPDSFFLVEEGKGVVFAGESFTLGGEYLRVLLEVEGLLCVVEFGAVALVGGTVGTGVRGGGGLCGG